MPDSSDITATEANAFEPFDDTPSKPFVAKRLVHAQLVIKSQPPRLLFQIAIKRSEYRDAGISASEALVYALDVADSPVPAEPSIVIPGPPRFQDVPSQWDITVNEQSWVVIELDPLWPDWQFQTGFVALTAKASRIGQNHRLRHVYPSNHGTVPPGAEQSDIPYDGCRVAYFGVAERLRPPLNQIASQFVNFHTEFIEGGKRLQVIFDPDVPNGGPDAIPP